VAGVGQDRVTPRISSVKAVVVDVGWVNGLAAIRIEPVLINAGRVVRGVLR
jgi:hypothetical protein